MKIIQIVFLILIICQCSPGSKQAADDPKEVMDSPDLVPDKSEEETGESDIEMITEAEEIEEYDVEEEVDEYDDPKNYMDPFDPDFISGKWAAKDSNGFSFDTWFYVEDGYLKGQYCAMNEDATRVDCGTQDEVDLCYLEGPYTSDPILEMVVVSCYSQKEGRASIETYGDGMLLWKLIDPPGEYGVDHFAHKEAILHKTHFDPFE